MTEVCGHKQKQRKNKKTFIVLRCCCCLSVHMTDSFLVSVPFLLFSLVVLVSCSSWIAIGNNIAARAILLTIPIFNCKQTMQTKRVCSALLFHFVWCIKMVMICSGEIVVASSVECGWTLPCFHAADQIARCWMYFCTQITSRPADFAIFFIGSVSLVKLKSTS